MEQWVGNYTYATEPKKVGIVCAGNIPLVGFMILCAVSCRDMIQY